MTSDEKLLISQPTAEEKETKETKETKEERPEVEGILEIQEENNFGFLISLPAIRIYMYLLRRSADLT